MSDRQSRDARTPVRHDTDTPGSGDQPQEDPGVEVPGSNGGEHTTVPAEHEEKVKQQVAGL
jgi:hypothetical protein